MSDQLQDNNDSTYETWRIAFSYFTSVICSLMCLVGIFFMLAIFKTRKFTFNLYVIFTILPDALCNGIYATTTFYDAISGGVTPSYLCNWRAFQLLFYYHSNLYVNAVIAKETYDLVVNSYNRRRTKPPSTRRVCTQVGIVYGLTALLSGSYIAPISWFGITIGNDPYCVSAFKHHGSGMAIAMLTTVPAFLYVFWIGDKIRKGRLLPMKGRTRALALYFMRIIFIFVAFYIPMLSVAMVLNFRSDYDSASHFVILQVFTLLFPLQNIVTFKFMLEKDDISQALRDYISRILTFIPSFSSSPDDEINEWTLDDVYEAPTEVSTIEEYIAKSGDD